MVACQSRASAGVVVAVASGPTPIPHDIGGHGVQQGANHAEAGAKTLGPPGAIPAAFLRAAYASQASQHPSRAMRKPGTIDRLPVFRRASPGLLASGIERYTLVSTLEQGGMVN